MIKNEPLINKKEPRAVSGISGLHRSVSGCPTRGFGAWTSWRWGLAAAGECLTSRPGRRDPSVCHIRSHRNCLSVRNYPGCCHNSRTLRWEECWLQRVYEDIPLVEVDGLHRQARQWRSAWPCHQLGSCSDPIQSGFRTVRRSAPRGFNYTLDVTVHRCYRISADCQCEERPTTLANYRPIAYLTHLQVSFQKVYFLTSNFYIVFFFLKSPTTFIFNAFLLS